MPNKEVISSQNDVERLEIREQTKSKSEAKWKYKVRCVPVGVLMHLCICMCMPVNESTFREGCIHERGGVWGVCGLGVMRRHAHLYSCVCACMACASVCPPVPSRCCCEGLGMCVALEGATSYGVVGASWPKRLSLLPFELTDVIALFHPALA